MRGRRVEPQDVVVQYTIQHLTMQQIADLAGVSKAYVGQVLKRAGVTAEQGTWIVGSCAYCGTEIRRVRSQARRQGLYCNQECYFASLEKGYRPWRQGCRVARALVSQHFRLEREHVVHHHDGNNRNNDLVNLAVFASQADHMAHHRGRKVLPLWDGRTP